MRAEPADSLRRALILMLVAGSVGCSADAVSESEPTLETAGAFVVTGPVEGNYVLFRILLALTLENKRTVLLVFRHAVVKSIAEGRALAQGPQLKDGIVEGRARETFIMEGYTVVWFRTLTDEEKDAVL